MRTENLEENLAQQLAGLCHEHLFQVFLDVLKTYEYLDREMRMHVLRGYGLVLSGPAGPN